MGMKKINRSRYTAERKKQSRKKKSTPGGVTSRCEGPGVRIYLIFSRNRKKISGRKWKE